MAKRGIILLIPHLVQSVKEAEEAKMAFNTLLSSQLLASPQPVAARQFNVDKDGEMTGQATPDIRDERRFDRGSWIALAYALVVFVYSAAEIVYGLSLPYDGWVITWGPESTGAAIEVRFEFKGQDQPSNLRPGDLLVAVDGKPVTQLYAESLTFSRLRPPNWPDGHIIH
jgi:hypothetical protein